MTDALLVTQIRALTASQSFFGHLHIPGHPFQRLITLFVNKFPLMSNLNNPLAQLEAVSSIPAPCPAPASRDPLGAPTLSSPRPPGPARPLTVPTAPSPPSPQALPPLTPGPPPQQPPPIRPRPRSGYCPSRSSSHLSGGSEPAAPSTAAKQRRSRTTSASAAPLRAAMTGPAPPSADPGRSGAALPRGEPAMAAGRNGGESRGVRGLLSVRVRLLGGLRVSFEWRGVTSLNMAGEAALKADRALTQDGARRARRWDGRGRTLSKDGRGRPAQARPCPH